MVFKFLACLNFIKINLKYLKDKIIFENDLRTIFIFFKCFTKYFSQI